LSAVAPQEKSTNEIRVDLLIATQVQQNNNLANCAAAKTKSGD